MSFLLLLTLSLLPSPSTSQSLPQPTLSILYDPNFTSQITRHFCLSFQNLNSPSKNVANITYSETSRGTHTCNGCCSRRPGFEGLSSLSCHQAPFAKSLEAEGSDASVVCVDKSSNAFQGWILGQWFREVKGGRDTAFGEGLPISVEVVGVDCEGELETTLTECGSGEITGNPTTGVVEGKWRAMRKSRKVLMSRV
jgi:hypothetical protein